ncbi:phosphoenolpyruvate carboxykinase (ATP) [Acidomonas methanolica]|uniref:phosphoenolpyruvate carboxykinase (ATP) n=1 Tax=Acidomonas methanolica TaxID=437 RepID=UPI002119BC8B|nr:phosphoenolpyruvate carboxykinase (ATP) [Acidomonas methanolica]MCQ9156546.1 phosphoenolpyruvate carboxykinase (ATP) [Acidomonas methanolica]
MSAVTTIEAQPGIAPEGTGRDTAALAGTGLAPVQPFYVNLQTAPLVTLAVLRDEIRLSEDGAVMARTGEYTGRSAQDKYVANDPDIGEEVWWHPGNNPLAPESFDRLAETVRAYLDQQVLFVEDLFAGADPAHRIRIRLVTTNAWHALFARNMFIRPTEAELTDFTPDYVLLHAPELHLDAGALGLRSSTAVAMSFTHRLVVIAGTEYAGEIKKSIFSVMNWRLPVEGVFPMHCSANIGGDGDVALFFGLSGTGKTTLSSDPERALIGDDEHGWSPKGVFNFEGGCYAKVINLKKEAEREIWDASHRFGAVLENVVADAQGHIDFDDGSLTENTRSCYPLDFLGNFRPDGQGGTPRNVIMLTADAFGVLPPVARLTPKEAMYHFLSGYTARVAGTEKGVSEPQATFSACFGSPFLPRKPKVYAELFGKYLTESGAKCWLVNTGWIAGPYGTGRRMSLAHTRAILRAILNGEINASEWKVDPHFGLEMPLSVAGVPPEVLDPKASWADPAAYDRQAEALLARFAENYRQFEGA